MENRRIGGGWVKTAKSGLKYISMAVELDGRKYNLSVFKNTKKANPASPDYNILLSNISVNKISPVKDINDF